MCRLDYVPIYVVEQPPVGDVGHINLPQVSLASVAPLPTLPLTPPKRNRHSLQRVIEPLLESKALLIKVENTQRGSGGGSGHRVSKS